MNQTESIILLAAVALAGYVYGKKRATVTASAAQQYSTDSLAWLGAWAA